MRNFDDTATCDRCAAALPAFGVMHGMIASHLEGGVVAETIYCHPCRDLLLDGAVNHPATPNNPVCTFCGAPLGAWSVAAALLARDIGADGTDRPLAFCPAHDQLILDRAN